jgi:transposase-like protein
MMDLKQNPDQADQNAQQLIRRTKQITRRRFTPEEKVRILIEGLRGKYPSASSAAEKASAPMSTTSGSRISWKPAKGGSRGTPSEKLIGPRWRPSSRRTNASRN